MDINSFVIGYAKGKASSGGGSGGGGSMEGFHKVQFFNDDRTTLLYTVFVPTGASAMYAGETLESTVDAMFVFEGFQPAATNVTADMDCFAVYSEQVKSLDQTSWAKISELSADGTAQNYFSVGDTKLIHIEGTVGTVAVNVDYAVYIIGFDHNEELEGKGIHFGTFKSLENGKDYSLRDEGHDTRYVDGTKHFNMNHWGGNNTYGGWAACDLRYDILGSTDKAPLGYGSAKTSSSVGYDASETCAINPVAGTLMAALPSDLRAVMKPMTKYTDGKGNKSTTEDGVIATIDYLPLLAEFEVSGTRSRANQYEQYKQKRYAYYAAGNSVLKIGHSVNAYASWWGRSQDTGYNYSFWYVNASGGVTGCRHQDYSNCLAPIFKV